jgi:hypothetical protein
MRPGTLLRRPDDCSFRATRDDIAERIAALVAELDALPVG